MLPMLSDVNAIPTPERDEIHNRSRRLASRFACGQCWVARALAAVLPYCTTSALPTSWAAGSAANVDGPRMSQADKDAANWPT
jgi:hypothetical protein